MNRKFLIISGIILLLAVTAGIFYWCSDRRKLNVMLDDAEHLVSKRPAAAPHDGVLKYAAVDRIFAEKLTVSCDAPALNMSLTNAELRTWLVAMHRHIRSLSIKSGDREFHISQDRAGFSFNAEISGESSRHGSSREVKEISGRAVKKENRWLISELHIKSVVKPHY